jgi:uncharacterized protein (DUF58 family)
VTAHLEGYVEDLPTLDARRYAVAVRKLADSLAYGGDRSPFMGSGVEYVQSRPYVMGDSVRAIDWRVTARMRKFYVKEYEATRCMPALFLLDTSASMAVGSTRPTKYETALFVAGGLALACLDRMSPVGLVTVGDRALRVRPSLSTARVLEWMTRLRRYRYDEGTSLGRRVRELAPGLPERTLVFVLSDLHDADAAPQLRLLAAMHDVVVLEIADPAEDGLRGAGLVRVREAESGREAFTWGRDVGVDLEASRAALKRAGVDHLRIRTDRPFVHALRRMLAARGAAARGTR